MNTPTRRELLASLLAAPALAQRGAASDWIPLFDGKSLNGWKSNESSSSFKVLDGAIVADGPRSHLFYTGPVKNAIFRNFELRAKVRATPGANSGIFFHTRYLEKGWPDQGFEVQVNNSHTGEGNYRENKKTASLYGVRNVYKALVPDNEWFDLRILVRGKRVEIWCNDMPVVDYVEADPPVTKSAYGHRLAEGTFALQCHDPHSKVSFRDIAVRPLADDFALTAEKPVVDDLYLDILRYGEDNLPIVDYHVHLKGGFTLDDALALSRKHDIMYGLALNVGLGFPVSNDAGALDFLATVKGKPCYAAIQGEGREWPTLLSKETMAKFDYVFTDAMTFRDDRGKRMRIWIKDEVGAIDDAQAFMETYVNRIEGVLRDEPIDIHVNPTFLPDVIAARYDELWTPSRMARVIEAAKKNDIAIEINNRYRIPSPAFLKAAKQAGVKFSFGTNNGGPHDIGRLEYSLAMVKECGLKWPDIFVPKRDGEKRVQRKAYS
ncbi:MAG: family 16 glycoside hydrolase [Bryobacteraceae bacterium]|nr:family 16 glycoside hydrolase [Bryobacteraceae bacterium]